MDFKDLLGKTLTSITVNDEKDEIVFKDTEGHTYEMWHSQDCCENVAIEDVNGDLNDLIGSPLLVAEEAVSDKPPLGVVQEYEPDSQTWTFYKLATVKGHVDIRWFGTSNGYYSERVSFRDADDPNEYRY